MKIDLSKPSAPRRFKAVFSGLYDLGADIIADIESRGYAVPVSSLMMRLGKIVVIPVMLEKYTTGDEKEIARVNEEEEKCTTIIETFITKSAVYWAQIKERDMNFLIENSAVLFSDLPEKYVTGFTSLFSMKDKNGAALIKTQDIDDLWKFLEAMVRISIRHIHNSREPTYIDVVSKSGDGKVEKCLQYTKDYCPTIKVSKLVDIWQIKSLHV